MINKYYSYPPCNTRHITIENLDKQLKYVDLEPEEIQRGEVLSKEWAQNIIRSIVLGVRLQKFTWSKQKNTYEIKVYGVIKQVHIKNIDSLQRCIAIRMFQNGEITIPKGTIVIWVHNESLYGKREIKLDGLSITDFESQYEELFNEVWLNYPLEVDEYGVENNYLTPQQETYLFKTVLNNGNQMNGQQWRNPTVGALPSAVRRDARLNPIELFKIDEVNGKKISRYFNILNSKMEYDEILAKLYHFLYNGVSQAGGKKGLDTMYDDPNFIDDLNVHSSFLAKDVNLRKEADKVITFMQKILEDKQYRPLIDKSYIFSLMFYSFLYIDKYGVQSKFDYKDLKKKFFKLHTEMITLTPTLKKLKVEVTPFRDALARLGQSKSQIKLIINEWTGKLGWNIDSKFQ
jgi:hypothetical protein